MNASIKSLTFIIALIACNLVCAQNFEWAKAFGAMDPYSIVADAQENVYTMGIYSGTVDFDPGAGVSTLTAWGNNYDVFVQKLDASGNFIWAKSLGGDFLDFGIAIAVDASGNVYTMGYFNDVADFDPGTSDNFLTSAGARDIFIQKMDADGNFLWAKSLGGTSDDEGRAIAVDATGNVYTTGFFQGTVDFDPGAGTSNLTSIGGTNGFIQKLDASGNFVWVKALATTGYSIAIDATGNIYTTGSFGGTVDFDPGAGTSNLTATGLSDVFVQKLNSAGNFIWAKCFGGTGSIVESNTIRLDAAGNVYTAGIFINTADFDPGAGTSNLTSTGDDIYVQKMDATGNFLWARNFAGTSPTTGDINNSLAVDAAGNTYTTGFFVDTVDFDPGAGNSSLVSAGSSDVFIQKMDAAGNFVWAKSFGNSNDGIGMSIAVDASQNVYTTGSFSGTVDFDPGAGVSDIVATSSYNVFVHKMSQPQTGINDWKDDFKILAYPNPASEIVQLTLEKETSNVELTLRDMQGRIIFAQTYTTLATTTLEMPCAKGVYILNIRKQEGDIKMRLVRN